jgi:hypothetical protein
LPFRIEPDRILIATVQREHATAMKGKKEWTAKRETDAAKELKQELGMHPSEFLFLEFLYRNREQVRRGIPLLLAERGTHAATIGPILKRYFTPARDGYFSLDLKKKIVREILGLP